MKNAFNFLKSLSAASLLVMTSSVALAQPEATIDQLSWMTGSWATQFGANTLEENWTTAENGSITSMVRMHGGGTTSMIEVIVIEEKDGSLEMSIQQWGPGFVPQSDAAQKMELTEISENRVKFTATTEGTFHSLTYARPTDDTFTIEAARAPDAPGMPMTLQPK